MAGRSVPCWAGWGLGFKGIKNWAFESPGRKSINFYFIMVSLRKSIKVWYSRAQKMQSRSIICFAHTGFQTTTRTSRITSSEITTLLPRSTYTHIHTYTCIYIYICVHIYIYIYICMYVRKYLTGPACQRRLNLPP